MKSELSEMIAVDFIKVTFNFFKPNKFERVKFDEIETKLLPRKGDAVVIENSKYMVEQLEFYPFGDREGTKGVRVYIKEQYLK